MPIIGYKFYGRNIRPYLYAEEKKSHTILGMTLFSLVIFGAFAIRPSIVTISRLQQEVKKAEEAKTFLDQKIQDLSQAQINYQLALEDIRLVDQALPPEPAVPAILETLALTAGKNNITLEATTFGDVSKETKPQTLPLTIKAAGEFPDLKNFISELENGIRQMDVKEVKITLGEENLVAEIESVVYFYE